MAIDDETVKATSAAQPKAATTVAKPKAATPSTQPKTATVQPKAAASVAKAKAPASSASGTAMAAATSTNGKSGTPLLDRAGAREVFPASRRRSNPRAPKIPQSIGKYPIMAEIARGGMGVVYKSRHPVLGRDIVIKKMLSVRGNEEEKERFTREAKILFDMQSPYIVKFLDTFDDARYRYIVEEFVEGVALDKLLDRQKTLPPEVAMLILRDVCYALEFAHNRNVVHRDIKPGNVLISKHAEIKLTDFGIGRRLNKDAEDEQSDDGVTRTGAVLGTPAYMPPEQFDDSSSVDQRADIYATGVMLYVMVTGTKPYPGGLTPTTMDAISRGKYTPPHEINAALPRVVCRLIKKMMQPNAKKRYQSVKPIIKICQNYLKRYDVHDILVEIARAVAAAMTENDGAYQFKKFVPKDARIRKALAIAAMAFTAAGAFSYLWHEGYIHRTILRSIYTPVDVRMQLPTSRLEGTDLPIKAFFFEDAARSGEEVEGDGFPEVNSSRREFFLVKDGNGGEKTPSYCTYSIKSAFLRHGDYRVKVVAGPYVWWKSFNVGSGGVLLECDFLKEARRPLQVKPYAYDADTGQEITKKCRFTVLQNNKWRSLEAVARSREMVSGQVWRIKVSCDGYQDEIFSLLLDWYQDELYISSSMIREGKSNGTQEDR